MVIRIGEINWGDKFHLALKIADEIFKEGNKNLDLTDRKIFPLVFFVGHEAFEDLRCFYWGMEESYRFGYPALLYDILKNGHVITRFEDWTPPQVMAAFAASLVSTAEETIDELPPLERTTFFDHREWTREEIIAESANLLTMALEVCYFGRRLLTDTITPNPEKVAELFSRSEIGKYAVSFREDQQLKPQWQAHCKKAVESGRTIAQLEDFFQIEGCSMDFKKNVDARTLKRWAKEATGIEFKPGRPKK
jgi:hypothetical protein